MLNLFSCRATLNLSRRLEKEVQGFQKEKERFSKEISEAREHIQFIERKFSSSI